MKVCSSCRCFFAAVAIFVSSAHLTASEAVPLFQSYLTACRDTENQPVHLRNTCQEKEPFFTEMTILDLDISPAMQVEEIAERVLYADVDVVHLTNTPKEKASYLYEMLQPTYSHFIHVPSREKGLFIASKYPLSKAAVTFIEGGNTVQKVLEFAIHGANTYDVSVCSHDLSTRMIGSRDSREGKTTPIFLFGVPGALTSVQQKFSPFQLTPKVDLFAAGSFQIIPVKHGGGRSDDKGGCKGEIDVGYSWGGKDGGHWEGAARFEASDNRGNYVEVEVKQNDKGEGNANVRAGHDEK